MKIEDLSNEELLENYKKIKEFIETLNAIKEKVGKDNEK